MKITTFKESSHIFRVEKWGIVHLQQIVEEGDWRVYWDRQGQVRRIPLSCLKSALALWEGWRMWKKRRPYLTTPPDIGLIYWDQTSGIKGLQKAG